MMAEQESELPTASKFTVRPLTRAKGEGSSPSTDSGKQDGTSAPQPQSGMVERRSRLRELTDELHALEARLRLGGGAERIERQHKQGKLTARERVDLLLDKDSYRQEIGLLVAY